MQDADFWSRVKDGEVIKRTDKYLVSGEEHWLQQVFTPILDSDGFPYKILNMATDITANKKQEIELQVQAQKMVIQEDKLRQNLEELQKTQDSMAAQQAELNEMNLKLKNNEDILVKAVEKSKDQEKELQMKVQELNKLHKELEIQQAEILDQNRELQEKERLQAKALLDADKNLERARVKIMAEFVRNLERQSLAMDKAEEKLRSQDNVPKESIATLHEVNSEFKILISKYKLD